MRLKSINRLLAFVVITALIFGIASPRVFADTDGLMYANITCSFNYGEAFSTAIFTSENDMLSFELQEVYFDGEPVGLDYIAVEGESYQGLLKVTSSGMLLAENANVIINGRLSQVTEMNWQSGYTMVQFSLDPTVALSVTYSDGLTDAQRVGANWAMNGFEDDIHYGLSEGDPTPACRIGSPFRDGYTFAGWDPEPTPTVTDTITYTAIWQKNETALVHSGNITATLTDGTQEVTVAVADSDSSVIAARWSGAVIVDPDTGETSWRPWNEPFTSDKLYRLFILINSIGDNEFSDETVFTINGNTYVSSDSNVNVINERSWEISVDVRPAAVSHTVLVSSSPVGHATGQGTYFPGEEVTVSVEKVEGYTFTGWYNGSTFVNGNMTYIFTMGSEDLDLNAVFTSQEGAKGTLQITGSSFTVNTADIEQNSSYSASVSIGTLVKVRYTGNINRFLYWTNESGKVISTTANYEFTMLSNTSLTAVEKGEGDAAKVIFQSGYGRILLIGNYTSGSNISVPSDTIKVGYEFQGWQIKGEEAVYAPVDTAAALQEYIGNHPGDVIYVEPVFARIYSESSVTIHYEGIDYEDHTIPYDGIGGFSVSAPESLDGAVLSHWEKDGETISTNITCPIYVDGDETVTAVYVMDPVGGEVSRVPIVYSASVSLLGTEPSAGKYRITYVEMYDAPDGYDVIENGLLYTTSSEYGNAEHLSLDSADVGNTVVKKTSSVTDPEGMYSMTFKMFESNDHRYVRAYLVYRDSSGNLQTIYTNIVDVSYGSLA